MSEIIDGVDVSECSYFNKETGFCKLGFKPETPPYCEQFTCYYKNFKRLQTENEKLKKLCDNKDELLTSTTRKSVELQAENKRLKEENGKQRIEIYKQGQLYLKAEDKAYNYRQTLQEIREMARHEVETRMLFADKKSFCDFNIILAKINEVIGAEE